MVATADLASLERTAYRDTQRDGLTEIVAGVFLFIAVLATGRPSFYWTYLLGIFLLGRGLKWLKARYTYERIGFAELPDEDRAKLGVGMLTWVFGVLAVMFVVTLLAGDVTDSLTWRQWAPAMVGFMCMGGFLYLASRSGLPRQYAYVVIGPALGILLSTETFTDPYAGVRIWALVMGVLLLAGGGIAFWRFLRDNPVIDNRGPDPNPFPESGAVGDGEPRSSGDQRASTRP